MQETLDQQICNVAHQLWLRGLISGGDGLISAELHRRRYLVTSPGVRRSDLKPRDLSTVDIGGVAVDGQIALDPHDWLPHRLAYQRRVNPPDHGEDHVRATLLARPPMTLALLRKSPDTQTLQLMGLPPVGIIDASEETAIKNAVAVHQCVAIRDTGLLCLGSDLSTVVNGMEAIEHAATVELACG